MRAIRLGIFLAATAALIGAQKQKAWKTGKILDSKSKDTYVTHARSFGPYGPPVTVGSTSPVDQPDSELVLAGTDYLYRVSNLGRTGLIHSTCRYIVGDPIRYTEDTSSFTRMVRGGTQALIAVDADGHECRLEVLRQERVGATPTQQQEAQQAGK